MSTISTKDLLILARHRAVFCTSPLMSSALACLADAIHRYDDGDYSSARMWCLKSLAYSIGKFDPEYIAIQ